MYLGKENSKIHISGDGNRVIVETKSGKHEYKPFDQNGIESGSFPSKLRQWYLYAASFVETLRRKQPKIMVQSNKQVQSTENGKNHQINMKLTTVLTLSGHIETTIKHKIGSTDQPKEVIIKSKGSPNTSLEIEQIVCGQKRT